MRLRVGDHAQFKIAQTQTVRVRTQIPNEYSVSSSKSQDKAVVTCIRVVVPENRIKDILTTRLSPLNLDVYTSFSSTDEVLSISHFLDRVLRVQRYSWREIRKLKQSANRRLPYVKETVLVELSELGVS